MFRTRLFALILAGVIAVLATGCILDVQPETATNLVGTEHTVVATLLNEDDIQPEEFCDNFLDALEDFEEEDFTDDELTVIFIFLSICEGETGPTGPTGALGPADHNLVNFEIISGPNVGLHSDTDGTCDPSCDEPDEDLEVAWTYQSNGIAGTDVIEVCWGGEGPPEESFPTDGALSELLVEVINETLGAEYYESAEDFFCQTVEKTWVAPTATPQPEDTAEPARPSRPNIGAGLSGLFAGQPTALPTAPAPAAVAPTQTTIRPPSTGDAGLR